MVKNVYEVTGTSSIPTVSQQVASSSADVFDHPTFSMVDGDKPEAEIDTTGHMNVIVQSPRGKEFADLPIEKGDRIKLAFLVGFPLVAFLIGVIITSQYV